MYSLFNNYTPSRGIIEFGRFRVLREQLLQNLNKAIDYYRTNRTWIDNKHPLVALINSINTPLSLETQVYNDRVTDRALELGQIFRYTSAVSRGTMHEPSMFYGAGVADAVLISIEYYDVDEMETSWRDADPIRILRHPKTDLGLLPLNGSDWSPEEGIAVVAINLPMLAVQYRMWLRDEGTLPDGEIESIPTFLSRYPMANALRSHFDLAVFNRMCAIYRKKTPAEPSTRTPFWSLDLASRLDDILIKELVSLDDRRITFDDMLNQIPMVSADCLGDLFRLPERGIYTRQVIWLYTLFRLPLLEFLLQQNSTSGNQRNTYYLKEIRRYFIATGNDRDLIQMIPSKYQQQVFDQIRYGILPYLHPTAFGMESHTAYQEDSDSEFTHLDKIYNLNKLLQDTQHISPQSVMISDLDWIFKYSEVESDKRVDEADPSVPILATRAHVDGRTRWVVVDGLHRLAHAMRMGLKSIQVREVPKKWFDDYVTA